MADEKESAGDKEAARDLTGARGASGTDITGGTDKTGRGALASPDIRQTSDPDVPKTTDAPAAETAETGDILGASSTHAGAGGVMDNTGGTGTAPTGGSIFGDGDNN